MAKSLAALASKPRFRIASKCSPMHARHPLVPSFWGSHFVQLAAAFMAASKFGCSVSASSEAACLLALLVDFALPLALALALAFALAASLSLASCSF